MNFELIGILVRLRYKLLWAKTRTRNGKIALFFAGYLLLVMVLALFGAGGLGAGMTAIRSGKGTLLAGVLLGGIYAQAMLASVILGFGMNTVFSEAELRRYPLRETERRLTRHFIGVVDPFWILFLVLDLGIALGLYLFGVGSFWLGLIAVLLLFVSNYAAARVLGGLVDRLMAKKGGSIILLVSVMAVGMLPSVLQPVIHKNAAAVTLLGQLWRSLPPAGAAMAMTRTDLSAFSGMGMIVLWTGALLAALAALERRPAKAQVAQSAKVSWESRIDRIGALFGPTYGPLVAHWMRFYFRNNRFRTIYPLTLPLGAFIVFFWGRRPGMVGGMFPAAVAGFSIIGAVGTFQFAVNQFGYVGGGFRRFLLLPRDPAAAFRAGSFAFVSLSAALIPVAGLLWALFSPKPFDARALAMLVSASVTSLFGFHGVALWTSLLGPRRGNFNMSLGNDLSFAGNVAVIGGMMSMLFLPALLHQFWPAALAPEHWWATPPLAVVAAAFYFTSLKSTTALFRRKREALMAMMEGRG